MCQQPLQTACSALGRDITDVLTGMVLAPMDVAIYLTIIETTVLPEDLAAVDLTDLGYPHLSAEQIEGARERVERAIDKHVNGDGGEHDAL